MITLTKQPVVPASWKELKEAVDSDETTVLMFTSQQSVPYVIHSLNGLYGSSATNKCNWFNSSWENFIRDKKLEDFSIIF